MITKEGEILSRLIEKYPIRRSVTDFGARLSGSNSRHLIEKHKFRGVLIDKSHEHCRELRENIPSAHVFCELVTPDNCNEFVNVETGILCIDIDGNDYHIWKAIRSKPDIVVIESGSDRMILKKHGPVPKWIPEYIPASPKRHDGASDEALIELGTSKGYRLHAKQGVNLIFLSNEIAVHATTQTARIPSVQS